ncbi:hypothetical protein GCM10010377_21840 [Streptomyces viridiviolaceus]|uniref:TraR/DksA family transcriptional regulator n=1 Tax=Streptomyces viridiviolaceus TaxID=68282 RepID=A0ABW2DVY9_9ACTN|nr:TraR/DksA family transcriptional regulator [Streptomyces viridiviolaceus]GHB31123.1 hypothetical protein GCM10010377_21840 [Streptomyces viridiviolaceus]
MVAKKTAVQQPAPGTPTGAGASGGAAEGAGGKRSTQGADRKAAAGKRKAVAGPAPVETAGETAAEPGGTGKGVSKKGGTRKSTAKRGAAGKSAAGKGAAKESAGKQGAAGEGASGAGADGGTTSRAVRKSTAKKAGAAQAAEQTGATTVVAKKTPGTATAAKSAVPKARGAAVDPGDLAVRPGEDPWTSEEVEEARGELQSEVDRLRAELTASEQSLQGLMRDSGDGAGHDEADTGSKNITREHELALAANAREMLTQTERALERLDAGTYGLCENCGNPIGKARMQAFPRATLCVECKQKQERRY